MPDAPLVIVNPAAGNGRAGRLLGWIRERLDARPEARLEITRRPGDAERWAAEAAGRHDRVVAVGGGTVVGDLGRVAALRRIPNLYRGRHVARPQVEMRRARRVAVAGEAGTLVHLDGEPFGGLPLEAEVRPAAVTVAVPIGAVGSRP